jgi:predicted nucleic acid-binding protein
MNRPENATRLFVIDTNVFVAAIKPFTKVVYKYKAPSALDLIITLITSRDFHLLTNPILLNEYRKLAQQLNSPTSTLILRQLTDKMETINVIDDSIINCKLYIPGREAGDIVHAATCFQTGAILITNDSDFDRIRDEGIIKV